MKEIEEDLEYGFREKFKSFTWNGVIKREVHDTYSGMGAVSSDLCLYGDLRDLAIQAWNYLFDRQDFDQVVMGLSVAGIGFSSAPFVNGSTPTFAGFSGKCHALTNRFQKGDTREYPVTSVLNACAEYA